MALPATWKLIQAPINHCTQRARKSPSVSLQAKGNATALAFGTLIGESAASVESCSVARAEIRAPITRGLPTSPAVAFLRTRRLTPVDCEMDSFWGTLPMVSPRRKKDDMTITLPLEPQKEAKLIAVAESKGMTANELLSQAIDKIIADAPEVTTHNEPTISLRGLLAKYGTAPSAEEIDQNRADMFRNFPRSDF